MFTKQVNGSYVSQLNKDNTVSLISVSFFSILYSYLFVGLSSGLCIRIAVLRTSLKVITFNFVII
jgi:hypothetical protein